MPKRKFSDLNDRPSGPVDIKLARLTAKFDNGVTALSRALKTARAFERQKLGRREKTAKSENKPEALTRIEEEIRVIKTLNFQATAEKYLFKQLVKTKRIAESPVFVKFKERKNISTEGPRSTAEANVTARLYKSNPVKNVFPGIMDGIRQLLGLEAAPAGKKSGSEQKKGSADQRKSESKEPETSLDGRSEPEEGSDADSRKSAPKAAARSAKLASDEADGEEGSDVDMDDADSVDYSHFDARLASGSGSDSDGERYFSGSESEPEDLEGAAGPPRRKNRMGQQARRALWEKKYGSGANHIKKQKENEWKNRDSGWDTRRGATGGTEGPRGKRGLGQGRPWQRDSNSTGGDRPQRGPPGGSNKKNVKDDKPLHPSWEAARKAKEQKSMAAFQGKKVTFD
ncbi:BUD22 family protein [Aspergillus novofumigatus IBT 16806]|uniref:Putative cellular morphogenesis protein n=1 Tax=Aspergillus novofumigatus (strain IBT 16806) TaxID=1392255 RepID=A0A2I1CCY6_ASPN1|nr:putative cellular morphogenesis protein [Aspergillus novofumigatus IBT 16806]PKX95493.1 putative cellular morphogenesis protein [Aspergillus novofumigatus IBT 16806]